MLVVFTANEEGGILQFAVKLTSTVKELGKDVMLFIPKNGKVTIPEKLKQNIIFYEKVKTISINDKGIKRICREILGLKPSVIWYADAALLTRQIIIQIKGKKCQLMCIHDPAGNHPSNRNSAKDRLKNIIYKIFQKKSEEAADKIVLMSPTSLQAYKEKCPKNQEKVIEFTLGAHVPEAEEIIPNECSQIGNGFFLFFGRVDKYKGIGVLVEAYNNLGDYHIPLVIAGKGMFSKKEKASLGCAKNTYILNRYIEDGEMIWLFKNAKALILPYIEASQSGILPIAYQYGIPVITSDVAGLTQFVVDGKTGIICKSVDEFTNAIKEIGENSNKYYEHCKMYYELTMDWERNVGRILKEIDKS